METFKNMFICLDSYTDGQTDWQTKMPYQYRALLILTHDKKVLNYTMSQKQDALLLPITSPNVDRFSKFFHRRTQKKTI